MCTIGQGNDAVKFEKRRETDVDVLVGDGRHGVVLHKADRILQQVAWHFALLHRCIERCFAHIGAHGALLVGIGLEDGGAQFVAAGGHVGG